MDENTKKDLFDLNYSQNFNIKDNQEQSVDLELIESQPGTSTITGLVLDSEQNPVNNATIKIFDSEGSPFLRTVTDEEGNYTFSGLKSGNYSIACVKENIILTVPENIYLQEDEVKTHNFNIIIEKSLELCSIAGHIFKNDDSQEIISGATISLLNAETRETVASTLSALDGEYVFYDIAEGSYILVATKIGYKVSSDTFVTAKNNTIINIDLKLSINPLENLGTVSGKISNIGVSIGNAFVGLYKIDELGKESLNATTKTNSEGIYMFGKVDGGQYKIKAKLNK